MIFVIIIVILGLVTKQPKRYWQHVLAAVVVQNVIGYLFYGGGTLYDPSRDGLITAMIRQATNDGPQMGILGIFVIIVGWGLPIWLVSRGYTRRNKSMQPMNEEAQNDSM